MSLSFLVVTILLLSAFLVYSKSIKHFATFPASKPIVLWHGIDDSCCNPAKTGGFKKYLEDNIPGVYVLSIKIGEDEMQQRMLSYRKPAKDQVLEACQQILHDEKMKNGYNAVGFSQGGLFMRALVQLCPHPKVGNLITFGSPHQGVFGKPNCDVARWDCDLLRRFLGLFVYTPLVQKAYVPFQYWNDPYNANGFKRHSIFLSEMNNVRSYNETYKYNLVNLNLFVMVMFLQDEVVIPKQSAWFGYYKPGSGTEVLDINETILYKEDTIGMQHLDLNGKLRFLGTNSTHMVLNYTWISDHILKYLL